MLKTNCEMLKEELIKNLGMEETYFYNDFM
jgi:hypothetical protein